MCSLPCRGYRRPCTPRQRGAGPEAPSYSLALRARVLQRPHSRRFEQTSNSPLHVMARSRPRPEPLTPARFENQVTQVPKRSRNQSRFPSVDVLGRRPTRVPRLPSAVRRRHLTVPDHNMKKAPLGAVFGSRTQRHASLRSKNTPYPLQTLDFGKFLGDPRIT